VRAGAAGAEVERDLHRNHSLRTHGILIGTFTLLLMWGVSALQMHLLHVDSLAVRYFLTLGVGYLGYLLVLRWWARRLVEDGVGAPTWTWALATWWMPVNSLWTLPAA
jgi:hypothetical protein